VLPLFSVSPNRQTGEPPTLRPVVGVTYPMSAMAEAHRAMEKDETFGKVVLVWDPKT
jgi:hypothetical protein